MLPRTERLDLNDNGRKLQSLKWGTQTRIKIYKMTSP